MNRFNAIRLPLRCLIAASALSLGLAAGQALADPAPGVKVSYADLDLAKPAGAEALYNRIESAARSVCGRGRVDARDLERFTQFRRCYQETMQAALKQVNHSGLYAVHKRKVKAPVTG